MLKLLCRMDASIITECEVESGQGSSVLSFQVCDGDCEVSSSSDNSTPESSISHLSATVCPDTWYNEKDQNNAMECHEKPNSGSLGLFDAHQH